MAEETIKVDQKDIAGNIPNGQPVPMTPEEASRHEVFSQWMVAGKEAKKPIEWEWFVRKNYLDGNHWIRFNQNTQSIEQVSTGNKFRVTINQVYRITRAVRAYVTKHHPKWEVMAQDTKSRVFQKSIASERLLDSYYFEEKIRKKMKEIVYDALYASVGHLWFWWDAEERWLRCIGVDPWDFIPDPTAEDTLEYSDAQFIARAFKTKVRDIQNNDEYAHRDLVIADNLLAASDMKATLMRLTSGVNQDAWTNEKDLETVLGFEIYYRVREANAKGGYINHAIITATATLVDEPTKFKSMPARTYHTDTETGKQYTQGWVKNMIGPQKMIDKLETQTLEYNHIFGKGRYVTEKGSGVTSVVNKNGHIIQKNKGKYFEQLRTESQPASVDNQIVRANRYIEDVGSAHDAFVGRMPTGANSGVAIENLLLGEENNLTDLRDNLDEFLMSVGRFVLAAFALHKMNIMTMFNYEPSEDEPKFYAAVGNASPIRMQKTKVTYNGKEQDILLHRILEDNNVRVTMGTWIGTNKIGGQEQLMKLAEAGLIDRQTILEFWNAPNIPRIMERLNKEATQKAIMQAAVAQPPGTVPAIDNGNAPQSKIGGNGASVPAGGAPPMGTPAA